MKTTFTLYDLERMLEDFIDNFPEPGRPMIKVLIGSVNDLKINLNTGDHNPPHFHVKSTQRRMNARFDIYSLEFLSLAEGSITRRDIKKVQIFFLKYPDKLNFLRSEYNRIQKDKKD